MAGLKLVSVIWKKFLDSLCPVVHEKIKKAQSTR